MLMLDEKEFADVIALFDQGARSVKEYCKQSDAPIQSAPMPERFEGMLARYEAITAYKETNPNAVWHHTARHLVAAENLCAARRCGSCMTPRA